MEQKRDSWDINDDIGDVLADLQITRQFQAYYSEMFDHTDKNDYQKLYDHDKVAIMERVLFDRLYDKVTALDRLHEELRKVLVQERTEKEAKDKHHNYITAADIIRGKAAANVNE